MKDRVIIFGAGEWGKTAYYYYKNKCEIICFIDNSEKLWGTFFNGIEICSPEQLRIMDLSQVKIIIANKRRKHQIQSLIYKEYGIRYSIVFEVKEDVQEHIFQTSAVTENNEHIVRYEGGLGNQMFQYAFARCFQKQGYYVTGDFLDYYNIGRRKFILTEVFSDIHIPKCNPELKKIYKDVSNDYVQEMHVGSVDYKETDMNVLQYKKGYFEGYWQSYKYAEMVEQELRKEFVFPAVKEDILNSLSRQIQNQCAVSIHIRRGDYLQHKTQEIMGGICTIKYYQKAIKFILKQFPDAIFYFFSEDIEWCKENFKDVKALFVDREMFDFYDDWYDMFLMSCCKHNIIANSTFSWWGAWLNSNENKIVIAPEKWMNICDITDICPQEWVRIHVTKERRGE